MSATPTGLEFAAHLIAKLRSKLIRKLLSQVSAELLAQRVTRVATGLGYDFLARLAVALSPKLAVPVIKKLLAKLPTQLLTTGSQCCCLISDSPFRCTHLLFLEKSLISSGLSCLASEARGGELITTCKF